MKSCPARTCSVCGSELKPLFSSFFCPACEQAKPNYLAQAVQANRRDMFLGVYCGNPFRPDYTVDDCPGGHGYYALVVDKMMILEDDGTKHWLDLRQYFPYANAWKQEPHWRHGIDRDYYEIDGLLRDGVTGRASGFKFKWLRREKVGP